VGGVRRDLSRPPPHRGRLRSAIAATVVPAVLQPGIEVGRTERPAAPRPFSYPGQIARARRLRDGAAGTTGVGCLLGATTRFGCPHRRIILRNKDISRRPVPIWPSVEQADNAKEGASRGRRGREMRHLPIRTRHGADRGDVRRRRGTRGQGRRGTRPGLCAQTFPRTRSPGATERVS